MGLAGFIRSLDEADDPDKALLEHVLEEADQRSPELARAIRVCALPRRFDVDVIGVLRGLPDDVDENRRIMYQLLDYSFVLRREKGGYVYHDRVRGSLLADWKQETRRSELEELTWRLIRHYEAAHARASQAEEDAARVSRIIQRASQARFRQLSGILETGSLQPLLEAVTQLALLSPATVLEFLERYLESYLDRRRFSACQALIAGARDVVLSLPEDDERSSVLDWLTFWDGALLVRVERPAEAERKLETLLEGDGRDARLRYWTLGELGQAQRDCFKLRDALATIEKEMALNERSGVDPLNLPVSYLRMGRTYTILERPDVAARYLDKALAAAEGLGDPSVIAAALEATAERQIAQGLRRDAFESSMRALDLVRTELRTRRARQIALAESLAGYFCTEDPRLMDTVVEEGEALAAGLENPLSLIRRKIETAALLLRSGQLRRAREMLAMLAADVEPTGSDALRADVLLEQAALDHVEERFEEEVDRLVECERLAAASERPGVAARAAHARARALARLGRWDDAEGSFEEVEDSWRRRGHDALAALARAERAAAVRRRGGTAEAGRLLKAAGEPLAEASASLRVRYLAALGEDEAARRDQAAARSAFREAASIAEASGDLRAAATARAQLAGLERARRRHEDAAVQERAAAAARRALAARDAYTRSSERDSGDRRNAEGIRSLAGEELGALDSAQELLRAALDYEADPWYRVNYSYATAALGDWRTAVDALEQALADAPALRCAALERRLAEYHVARDEALANAGEYAAAAKAFTESLARLEASGQRDTRARCLLGLGDSLRATGRLDEAGDAYREADALGHPAAVLRLGELFTETGDDAAAIEAFRAGTKSPDPDIAAESAARVIELDAVQSPDEVRRVGRDVRGAGGAAATLELGDRLAARGHSSSAALVYALVAEELPEAALRLGDIHHRNGDAAAAREAWERALESDDAAVKSAAATNIGELLTQQGDVDDVYAPDAALRLGELSAADGDPAEARRFYQRALASDDATVAPEAALRLMDDVHEPQATTVERVIGLGGLAALRLGDLLAERGQGDLAERAYRQVAVVEHDPFSPDAKYRLSKGERQPPTESERVE
jgi:tetratricopeptide (TPR) repeat protein